MITKKLYQPFLVLLFCCIAIATHTCRATGLAADKSILEKHLIDRMINNVSVDIENSVANATRMLDIYTNKILSNDLVLTDKQQQNLVVALFNKAKPFIINWHQTNQQELGDAYKALATYNTNEYYNVALQTIGYKLWLEKIKEDNKKNMHEYFAEKMLKDNKVQVGAILLSNSRLDHVMVNYIKNVLSICQKVKTSEIEEGIAALKADSVTAEQMRSVYQKIKNNSPLLCYNNNHLLKYLTSQFQKVANKFIIDWHQKNQELPMGAYKNLKNWNERRNYNRLLQLEVVDYDIWLKKINSGNKKNMHQYFAETILEYAELQPIIVRLSTSFSLGLPIADYAKTILKYCRYVRKKKIEEQIKSLENPKIIEMLLVHQKITHDHLLTPEQKKQLTSQLKAKAINPYIMEWHRKNQQGLGEEYKALATYNANKFYNMVLQATDYGMWLEKIRDNNSNHMHQYLVEAIIYHPELNMDIIGLIDEESGYWSAIIRLCRERVKATIDELVNKPLEHASDTANKLIGMRKTIKKNEKLFNKVPKDKGSTEPEKSFSDYLKEKAGEFITTFHKQRSLKIRCKALETYDDNYYSTVLQVTDYGIWLNKIKHDNREHMYQYAAKSILNDPFFELSGTDKLDKDKAKFIAHIVYIGLVQEEQQEDALGGLFAEKIDHHIGSLQTIQAKKDFFAKQKEKIQKYKTDISYKYPWLIRVQQWLPTLCLPISLSYGNYDWRYDFAKALVDALIIPQEQLEAYAAKDVNTYTKNVYAKEQYLILKERYPNKSAQDLKEEEKKHTLTFQYYLLVFLFVGLWLQAAYKVEELWLEYLEDCKKVRERKQNHH